MFPGEAVRYRHFRNHALVEIGLKLTVGNLHDLRGGREHILEEHEDKKRCNPVADIELSLLVHLRDNPLRKNGDCLTDAYGRWPSCRRRILARHEAGPVNGSCGRIWPPRRRPKTAGGNERDHQTRHDMRNSRCVEVCKAQQPRGNDRPQAEPEICPFFELMERNQRDAGDDCDGCANNPGVPGRIRLSRIAKIPGLSARPRPTMM